MVVARAAAVLRGAAEEERRLPIFEWINLTGSRLALAAVYKDSLYTGRRSLTCALKSLRGCGAPRTANDPVVQPPLLL